MYLHSLLFNVEQPDSMWWWNVLLILAGGNDFKWTLCCRSDDNELSELAGTAWAHKSIKNNPNASPKEPQLQALATASLTIVQQIVSLCLRRYLKTRNIF